MDFRVPDRIRRLAADLRRFLERELLPVESLVLERGFGACAAELSPPSRW